MAVIKSKNTSFKFARIVFCVAIYLRINCLPKIDVNLI